MSSSNSFWFSKSVIIAFLLGVFVAVFLFHAYIVYGTRNLAVQNRNDIAAIGAFLQQATGGTPVSDGGQAVEAE